MAENKRDLWMDALLSEETDATQDVNWLSATPRWSPQEAPCRIMTVRGRLFLVTDINAWGHTDEGVFAIGRWGTGGSECSILFPHGSIEFIEIDYEALRRYKESA